MLAKLLSLVCVLGVWICSAQTVPSLVPSANVNMASGTTLPDGDPFLQRQNECSIVVSSRDPNTLFAGCNDYRAVDIPGLFGIDELGDVWLGLFRSNDGGKTWKSTLHAGCPYNFAPCASPLAQPVKGFVAAADPTLAAGTNGMFYMTGIAFNRGTNAQSAILFSRFIDNNNKENGSSIAYLGTQVLASGTSGIFADKPWIAYDFLKGTPGATCTVGGGSTGAPSQTIPAGVLYATWSEFTGSSTSPSSRIMLRRSLDCGASWSNAQKLSESNSINQGTAIAIDPRNGDVYISWRRIASSKEKDAILIAKSTDTGRTFTKAIEVAVFEPNVLFDQPKIVSSAGSAFRAKAFPALAVDANNQVYVAWAQRGMAGNGFANDARIVVGMSTDGVTWNASQRFVADPHSGRGHQFMPTMTFAGGSLVVAFYDNRDDQMMTVYTPLSNGQYSERQEPIPGGNLEIARNDPSQKAAQEAIVFSNFISDATPGLKLRHTIDVRASQLVPGARGTLPGRAASLKVSQYKWGSASRDLATPNRIRQLQFNPPNFPMFAAGTAGFIGDYIGAEAQRILPKPGGGWEYNTRPDQKAKFHLIWADNRDVRPPPDKNWASYKPVAYLNQNGQPTEITYTDANGVTRTIIPGGTSLYDSTQTRPVCLPGDPNRSGMRNQNPYTAELVPGIEASTVSDQKPINLLSGKPRTFAVTVRNPNKDNRRYRLTFAAQPAGGSASFDLNTLLTEVFADVPPRSTASRIVFVRSTSTGGTKGQVTVLVNEVQASGFAYQGLSTTALINPDIVNPDIVNPDIVNPDIVNPDIVTAEVFTPTISNPDIVNPDIVNPDIVNPDIVNPDIVNPDIVNPDIVNPDIVNPDIVNPDIVNPDIVNPDIVNPDIVAGYGDYVWDMKNVGNTATSYSVKLYKRDTANICQPGCGANCAPGCAKLQLILHKRYTTPVAGQNMTACQLLQETQNPLISNVNVPVFSEYNQLSQPTGVSTGISNPSMALAPGETAQVTLRVFGNTSVRNSLNVGENFAPVVVSQAENTTNPLTPLTLLIKGITPANAIVGQPYTGTIEAAGIIEPLDSTGQVVKAKWEVTSAAPGFTFNPATRQLTFTPSVATTYSFLIKVTDYPVPGLSRSTSLQVQVAAVGQLTSNSLNFSLPAAAPGVPYSAQLTVTGGQTPLTFTEVGSNLAAAGLSLSPNGLITGTPLAVPGGSITFTVEVKDSSCLNASCTLRQTVTISGLQIYVDGSAPQITYNLAGTLGQNGWYTSDVSLTWYVTDPESGIKTSSGCAPVTLASSTSGVSYQCTATNNAGLVTTSPIVTIRIDKGAPVVTPVLSAPANAAGWHGAPVTVSWNIVPSTSGIAATTPADCPAQTISTATAGLTLSCSAASAAGVSALASVTIRIDLDGPSIVPTVVGAIGNNGWYRSNVTVSWAVSDSVSGIASSTGCSSAGLADDNPGVTLTCSAVNGAGVAASASVFIRIDKTAPVLSITTPAQGAVYGLNGPVNAAYTCEDATSGVASCAGPVANGAAIDTSTSGAKSFTVTAIDAAGNQAILTRNYSVGYLFTGFGDPLGPAGAYAGQISLGKAVPVKFSLRDGNNNLIQNISAIESIYAAFTGPAQNNTCPVFLDAGTPQVILYSPSVNQTGSTELRPSGDGFIYNWDSSSAGVPAGGPGTGCYTIVVKPAGGGQYGVSVRLN